MAGRRARVSGCDRAGFLKDSITFAHRGLQAVTQVGAIAACGRARKARSRYTARREVRQAIALRLRSEESPGPAEQDAG